MALYFSYKKGILLNLQTILTNSKIIITKKTNSTKKTNYNKINGQSGYSLQYDINGDGVLNVIELARIGLEYGRGT